MNGDLKSLLSLLVEMAPDLRKAGLCEVTLPGGCYFKLAPHEPEMPKQDEEAEVIGDDSDPLNDPGMYKNGRVPGYTLRVSK